MTKTELAKEFAYKAHKGQTRKGKNTPFTNHLEDVVEIIKGLTHDEDLIVTAWLHDTVEDTDTPISEIYKNFGDKVGDLVALETEIDPEGMTDKKSWKISKVDQLSRLSELKNEEKDVYIVTLSDKLSNLREMKKDYDEVGEDLWERFNSSKIEQEWYYTKMLNVINTHKGLNKTKEFEEMKDLINLLFDPPIFIV